MKLTEEIKEIRKENDFNENNLEKWREKLKKFEEEFNKPSNISIQHNSSSSSLINQISVIISPGKSFIIINIIKMKLFKINPNIT